MNKKNIVLILIISIFLSVMAISVWGKNPEKSGKIEADSIAFFDENNTLITRTTDTMDKEKVIEIQLEEDDRHDLSYTFSLVISPEDTTDPNVYTSFKYGVGTLTETTEPIKNDDGTTTMPPKHTYTISFTVEEQENTKIEFQYNKEDVTRRDYLIFMFTLHRHDVVG